MCGIHGFLDLHGLPLDRSVASAMGQRLRHRGPDDSGSFFFEPAGDRASPSVFLGHRRLSILDLSSSARQPLTNEDQTIRLVFNGEVYNHRDLRKDLESRGHRFRSSTDGETIVHAFEEFADDVVARLDGMFSFALWDGRRLLLARDKNGKKPLYYSWDGRFFSFASEIKALLACPWVDRATAVENLPELLMFGYVPAPRTLYSGILQLAPSSILSIGHDGSLKVSSYSSLKPAFAARGAQLGEENAAREVRRLVTSAVAKRLESDVPLGALLSGGLDSSIVVGVMSKLLKEPVRTFAMGFSGDESYDERRYAAAVARHFGTRHKEFVVNPDAAGLAERLLRHHDQPYGDSSAIPTYLVCEQASRDVKVALTGDGGDEVFAGYERFRAAMLAESLPPVFYPAASLLTRLLPRREGYYGWRQKLERFLADSESPVFDRYLSWISYFSPAMVRDILKPDIASSVVDERLKGGVGPWWPEAENWPILQKLLFFNHSTYLPDDLLVKSDRMSMAHGLELRSPFLDSALVEFAASLPPELKVKRGALKHILKRAFRDLLPPEILKRRKHGFGVPMGRWFRGELRRVFAERVLCGGAEVRQYLNPWSLQRLFQEHVDGGQDHGQRLWLLLNLELWLEQQKQQQGEDFVK